MAIEVGAIVEGTVSGIANFGAFITLPGNTTGLVHISEVADAYVKDVKDYLKERDKVLVKVINVDAKGKIGLSIKQARAPGVGVGTGAGAGTGAETGAGAGVGAGAGAGAGGEAGQALAQPAARTDRPPARPWQSDRKPGGHSRGSGFNPPRSTAPETFEDKLSKFIKESDQKLLEYRRSTDAKRGGRGAGRN